MRKGHIFTKLHNLSPFDYDDQDFADAEWRYKADRLQARRWRKIKHQLV